MSSFAQSESRMTFELAGNCGLCKQRIEKAAKIKGVSEADWNIQTNIATVSFDPAKTSATAIKQAIADVGHDTDEIKAKDEDNATLHECCI